MLILAKREDPDEMLHVAAFYQGLLILLRQNNIFRERNTQQFHLKIITCDPSINTMDHFKVSLLFQTRKKNHERLITFPLLL